MFSIFFFNGVTVKTENRLIILRLFCPKQLLIDSRVNQQVQVTLVFHVNLSSTEVKKLTRLFLYVPVLMKVE